jgi:hypothetical protein
MIINVGFGCLRVRPLTIIASLLLILVGCSSTTVLTEVERQKLDPPLLMLLRGEAVAESDFDASLRKDGTREYAVIIRSKDADEVKSVGIQVGSVFSDVITARVTIAELRRILSLSSVRAVQASSKNYPH